MSGRAKSAPLLRKKTKDSIGDDCDGDIELNVLDGIDEERDVVVPEAVVHDISIWPHMHSQDLQDAMFPTAIAVPDREDIDPHEFAEHSRLHRRWAATRIAVTRG